MKDKEYLEHIESISKYYNCSMLQENKVSIKINPISKNPFKNTESLETKLSNVFDNGVTDESIKKGIEIAKKIVHNKINIKFFMRKWMYLTNECGIAMFNSKDFIDVR